VFNTKLDNLRLPILEDTDKCGVDGAGAVKLTYVYRPVLLEGCTAEDMGESSCLLMGTGGNLQLPGYGVEMAIKNMEYSALDDSKVGLPEGKGSHTWL
jgi:hypothetical protein